MTPRPSSLEGGQDRVSSPARLLECVLPTQPALGTQLQAESCWLLSSGGPELRLQHQPLLSPVGLSGFGRGL